jgi:hypothetical protein
VEVLVLHATPGRLRVKPPVATRDAARAATLLNELRALAGVSHVETSPITGNVIILYDPQRVTQYALYARLEALFGGPVRVARKRAPTARGDAALAPLIARAIDKSAMDAAVQRAVFALI